MKVNRNFFQRAGRDVIVLLSLVFTLAIQPALADVTVFSEDFESGDSNWYSDNGVWQVGTPTAGPSACYGGTQCAGTVLAGDYPANTDSRFITLFPIQLPTVTGDEEISLRFRQWFSYAGGDAGYVQISVDGGVTFTTVGNTIIDSSTITPWSLMGVDLTTYAGQSVQIAFYHTADPFSGQSAGWFVDDVEIIHQTPAPVFSGDFETGWGDWYADRGQWQMGVPAAGPGACYNDSLGCAGTNLDGNYAANTDSRLVSPTFELPNVSGREEIHLRFRQWFSYAGGDSGRIQISVDGGLSFTTVGNTIVDSSPWSVMGVDLTAYAGQSIQIAFYHTADPFSGQSAGWYIDDIDIVHKVPAFTGDFEAGWGDWYADRGVWQVGTPTVGPVSCFSGEQCAGTVLDGNYPANTDSRLITPTIQLPSAGVINLIFRHWFSYAGGDSGHVQISIFDGTTWSAWTSIGGPFQNVSGGWTQAAPSLTAYAGQTVRFAFFHTADPFSGQSSGWYIDDVTISLSPDIAVSPASHDFGAIDVGSCSAEQQFDVSNNGNADLQIDTISLTGTDAGEYSIDIDNCSGQTIVPSASCAVNASFCPTSTGSKSAALSIPSNDLDQPDLDVPLTGTGGSLRLDIRANDSNGPLYVTPADLVDITIGLDPGPLAGNFADYWVGALTTGGTYWYDYDGTGTWVKSDIPESAGQLPLILLQYISVENSLLAEGLYTYFFILDDNPDGVFDITWLDHVVVISSDTAVSQKDLPGNIEVNLRKKLEKLMNK